MEDLIYFFSFQDPNIRYVAAGSVLLAISSALVGCFTFLKKKALVGDAVAHSVLPGICLAFLLSGNKNPVVLIIGAFITGWLALVLIDFITRSSKIKEDTSIGLILSVFFGIGILLLTMIQHSGNAAQTGLDSFLFGKAAALVGTDLVVFSSISLVLVVVVLLFYKEFALISFDEDFAKSIGFPVRRLELVLTTLTVLAVVTGIQAVGVVLMAAMLITPAAAARFWTDKLSVMLVIAAVFGAVSGISGAFISYTAPAMPTGPWIVLIVSMLALVSFFIAPNKGIFYKLLRQYRIKRRILNENILKLFYQLSEIDADHQRARTLTELQNKRPIRMKSLKKGLRRLHIQGYLSNRDDKWSLTEQGKIKGRRVVKLHRLWEVYLTKYLRIAPDHVHEDADNIEHILTPELERRLESLLEYPENDPHSSAIPYDPNLMNK
ncbi:MULTISPECIES: metal ABC transporter permease [Reichenbachiella]|uniref:Manganese/zinc/iron transport system permease protein n=1 Tax=Reichenbachiella agariperforans TaxID=156994 RepID=A0A1M6J5E8_REIAG|nr:MULTISPECIES: iron chelate uptake ABC transporter family permease subunit [Reichenbachiella]MBU2913069.1 metal ABC transporter permease [Reichenbachiella agariperforans]RJE74927.1 zinc ABC transporter permease [Reichenbachiella sp. MSK19-1]SHJ41928.1 manganese/zinc/iron transport system permease protein [Reichenbachiella agariperforans]